MSTSIRSGPMPTARSGPCRETKRPGLLSDENRGHQSDACPDECPYCADMQTVLFTLGLVLFLLGLLTGFAVPTLKSPRMALSSHLEAVLNGMFLVLLGLLWPHIHLPSAWGVAAVVLIVYSAYANWAAAAKEGFVVFLLVSLSLSIVVGLVLLIFGVTTGP